MPQPQRAFPLGAVTDVVSREAPDAAGLVATSFVLPTATLRVDAAPVPTHGVRVHPCGAGRWAEGMPVNRLSLWCINLDSSEGPQAPPPPMLVDVFADFNGCRHRVAHLAFAPAMPGGGVLVAHMVGPLCNVWEVWASIDPATPPAVDAWVTWQLGGIVERSNEPPGTSLGTYSTNIVG